MLEWLRQPWPWYVSGPLIGLMVPALLLLGNKTFGISRSLRHICAACIPANIPFFKYDWKKEIWNFFLVAGIVAGGFIAAHVLQNDFNNTFSPDLVSQLRNYGITRLDGFLPSELISWETLLSTKGFFMIVVGGFLVGFGTRYAGGCTSGHSISGLSNLQWPSFVATICFMVGGFIISNFVLPLILKL